MTGSSTFYDTSGASIIERGSSVFFDTTGAAILERGSSTFFDTGGTQVLNLIRGPQLRFRTVGDDRFVNRLASILSTTSAIDMTSTATIPLYTVPTGKIAVINGLVFRSTLGSATTNAEVSVGINPSTTNIFDAQELVEFKNTDDIWSLWSDKSTTVIAQASEQVDLDVITAATGGTLDVDAYLIGFLI